MTFDTMSVEEFTAYRDEALRNLDLAFMRHMMPGMTDEVALIGLHKARYEVPSIELALRLESGARGYGRMHDFGELLPAGELPQ